MKTAPATPATPHRSCHRRHARLPVRCPAADCATAAPAYPRSCPPTPWRRGPSCRARSTSVAPTRSATAFRQRHGRPADATSPLALVPRGADASSARLLVVAGSLTLHVDRDSSSRLPIANRPPLRRSTGSHAAVARCRTGPLLPEFVARSRPAKGCAAPPRPAPSDGPRRRRQSVEPSPWTLALVRGRPWASRLAVHRFPLRHS